MISVYLFVQIILLFFRKYFNINDNIFINSIYVLFTQFIVTSYIIYMVKKYYTYEDIGFGKVNISQLIWFIPYLYIIISMIYTFIVGIINNISTYTVWTWLTIIIIFIGTMAAGFCEEVLFRGIVLNTLRNKNSIVLPMLVSSIGFSIFHITTIFTGKTLYAAIFNVIIASLLGFSFAALALILNNITPLILYHGLWNFILIASDSLNITLSQASYYNNFLNIVIAVILWNILLRKYKKKKNFIFIN